MLNENPCTLTLTLTLTLTHLEGGEGGEGGARLPWRTSLRCGARQRPIASPNGLTLTLTLTLARTLTLTYPSPNPNSNRNSDPQLLIDRNPNTKPNPIPH